MNSAYFFCYYLKKCSKLQTLVRCHSHYCGLFLTTLKFPPPHPQFRFLPPFKCFSVFFLFTFAQNLNNLLPLWPFSLLHLFWPSDFFLLSSDFPLSSSAVFLWRIPANGRIFFSLFLWFSLCQQIYFPFFLCISRKNILSKGFLM